ncbi:MAG: hypothetical protein AAFR54_23520 [Planctomycetota bacterium]
MEADAFERTVVADLEDADAQVSGGELDRTVLARPNGVGAELGSVAIDDVECEG